MKKNPSLFSKMSQLPADCLNEIFECLEEDKSTLHSCLLVNRLWCEVSVRILWKSVLNYNTLIASFLTNRKKFYVKIELLFRPQLRNPHHLIILHLLKTLKLIA